MQARNAARQKTLENIETQQKLYKLRDTMTANPNTENFKNYNSYRKHLHDQFLKDARCNLLKHKADLEFQNMSLNHLYNQLIPLSKNTKIPDLEIQLNTKTKSQQETVDIVQSFYKKLY